MDHGWIAKADRQERDVTGAALGAGAGGLAMPVRREYNADVSRFRHLPEGVHNVPAQWVHQIARHPGPRVDDVSYTARMAQKIRSGKAPKSFSEPAEVHVWDDGSARQMNASHRIWAKTMAGDETLPVKVVRLKGPRPTISGAERLLTGAREKSHRRRLAQGKWSDERINTKARETPSRWNTRMGNRHLVGGVERIKAEVGPTEKVLRRKQGAFLAGGAAAGLGASRLLGREEYS